MEDDKEEGGYMSLQVGSLVVTKAATQRYVMGSDHCPLYIEVDVSGAAVHEACRSRTAVPILETQVRFRGTAPTPIHPSNSAYTTSRSDHHCLFESVQAQPYSLHVACDDCCALFACGQ